MCIKQFGLNARILHHFFSYNILLYLAFRTNKILLISSNNRNLCTLRRFNKNSLLHTKLIRLFFYLFIFLFIFFLQVNLHLIDGDSRLQVRHRYYYYYYSFHQCCYYFYCHNYHSFVNVIIITISIAICNGWKSIRHQITISFS